MSPEDKLKLIALAIYGIGITLIVLFTIFVITHLVVVVNKL